MGIVNNTLRDKFHSARLEDIVRRLEQLQGEVDDVMLDQLETCADQGSHQAQVWLAELYSGGGAMMGDWDVSLDEAQLNAGLARYWALTASTGEGFAASFLKDPEFTPVNLARVLVKIGDDQCKLRALTLIIRVAASKDALNGEAETFLQEHFAAFDLETFMAGYKAGPPLQKPQMPDNPQQSLL